MNKNSSVGDPIDHREKSGLGNSELKWDQWTERVIGSQYFCTKSKIGRASRYRRMVPRFAEYSTLIRPIFFAPHSWSELFPVGVLPEVPQFPQKSGKKVCLVLHEGKRIAAVSMLTHGDGGGSLSLNLPADLALFRVPAAAAIDFCRSTHYDIWFESRSWHLRRGLPASDSR